MSTLYHGSNLEVKTPRTDAGRRNLDFVVANRQGEDAAKGYDAVEGGVANDQVIDTVEDYEMGRITAEQALDQLRFKKPNHQLCIRNQEIIDKYLHFTRSYIIKGQD